MNTRRKHGRRRANPQPQKIRPVEVYEDLEKEDELLPEKIKLKIIQNLKNLEISKIKFTLSKDDIADFDGTNINEIKQYIENTARFKIELKLKNKKIIVSNLNVFDIEHILDKILYVIAGKHYSNIWPDVTYIDILRIKLEGQIRIELQSFSNEKSVQDKFIKQIHSVLIHDLRRIFRSDDSHLLSEEEVLNVWREELISHILKN